MRDQSFHARTVAVTGAGGSLGQALLRQLHEQGASLIALTSSTAPLELLDGNGQPIPLQQIRWQCGQEEELRSVLAEVDILVINHGVNLHSERSAEAVQHSLEVNALSSWAICWPAWCSTVSCRSRWPACSRSWCPPWSGWACRFWG